MLSFLHESEKQSMYSSHIPIGNGILFCLKFALDCRRPQSSASPKCPLELARFFIQEKESYEF